eukprot:CAMPEP_0184505034 /NCGR_PEP_ID=MMETSP0113_2-20130426/52775_1 /TAXON_ID=91329 /ORGANISM="Norrisiella sphaerica, Strain BC52" /LENGTH=358 /DNA_ID=CAMNT_0026894701 /DNA_START=390 /DNA_END=1464 /DNA_ORIENTATION=-
MSSQSPWLATDAIKIVLISSSLVTDILLIAGRRPDHQKAKYPMYWLNATTCIFGFFFFVGARDPYYFGWQAFLVLGSLCNICATSEHSSIGFTDEAAPREVTVSLGGAASLTLLLMLIGVFGTLATQDNRLSSLRHFSLVAAFIGMLLVGLPSLIRLRIEIDKLHPRVSSRSNHRSSAIPSKGKDDRKSVPSVKLDVHPEEHSKLSGLDISTSRPVESPGQSMRIEESSKDPMQDKTGKAQEYMNPIYKGSNAMSINSAASNASDGSKRPLGRSLKFLSTQRRAENMRKVRVTVTLLIWICPFIAVAGIAVLTANGIIQANDGENDYARDTDALRNTYDVREDLTNYVYVVALLFIHW